MFDKLVESRNHTGEARRRGGFLLTAFTAVFAVLTFALLYSLFSYNLAMAGEKLDISSLVAPVVPNAAPPTEAAEPKLHNSQKAIDKLTVRQDNIQRINEQPIKPPDGVSIEKNNKSSRPVGAFEIGKGDSPGAVSVYNPTKRGEGGEGNSVGINFSNENSKVIDTTLPPPVIKKPQPKAAIVLPILKTSRILNGQAVYLAKPPYPAPAKLIRAAGAVNVQVTIDETGRVTAANAVSGHPLLHQVSENAARSSKFSPTFLNEQKVKVTGIIVYNFIAQ